MPPEDKRLRLSSLSMSTPPAGPGVKEHQSGVAKILRSTTSCQALVPGHLCNSQLCLGTTEEKCHDQGTSGLQAEFVLIMHTLAFSPNPSLL